MGARLARVLREAIGDDRERHNRAAAAAGIDPSTLDQIVQQSAEFRIDCPPARRLDGFASALGLSATRLRAAAEADGCNYDNRAEHRFAEFRAAEDGGGVSGVLLRYGDVATVGPFRERFEPGALQVAPDVIANLQHDRGKPVARTDAGLIVKATADRVTADLRFPDTVYGREARELVGAKILRGFSVEFRASKDRWEDKTRIIERAELVGFALVDRPAYPDSVIAERMAETRRVIGPARRRVWV